MPLSQRAKQFAPFKSLAGLDDVIKKAEEEHRRDIESSGIVHVADPEAGSELVSEHIFE